MEAVNCSKLVEHQCLNLSYVVKTLSHSISEEQAWALCYQTVHSIQRDHCSLYLIEDMSHIIIDIDGNVHSLLFDSPDKSRKCTYSLRRFLSYFGGALFEALDFGFPEDEDRVLDPKLEHLIELLTETYDYNDENDSNDEGIEQDSPDDNEYRDKILQVCVSRLSPSVNAESHYKRICKELITETLELSKLIEKITTGQKELQKSSAFSVNNSEKLNKSNSNLDDVHLADWARPWIQVIREFKSGFRLKQVCFNSVNSPREQKLLPFEVLLDDIRLKRYKLNKILENEDIPQRVRKDAHALTLESIRSKPALVPVSKRLLPPPPAEQQTLYEKLMHSIRQPHKLKPTPQSSVEHSPIHLGRVSQGKYNPRVDTPTPHRRVIKPNMTLSLSVSSEDEEELNSEDSTNCLPESYHVNDIERKKSEARNVILESDFETEQKWFAGITKNVIKFFQRRS